MRIDVVATVLSPDGIDSPFTRRRAAAFHVEILEDDVVLGSTWIGDVLELDADGARLSIVVRRATMAFVTTRPPATAFDPRVPPEAVAFLGRASGLGTLGFREHAVARGAKLRVRAVVEESQRGSLVARDDAAPILLDEIMS